MSRDKNLYEARRWLDTAEEDLGAACVLKEQGKFSHACFFCHGCGEKALKALWFYLDAEPWGHSIQKLISDLPDEHARKAMEDLLEAASVLDRYYIPTRYPNGLPDLTPGKCYFERDALLCIDAGRSLLGRVKACMTL